MTYLERQGSSMIPQTLCELCGKPAPDYVVRTGVSAYLACKSCWTDWVNSDQTYEALNELKDKRSQA